MKIEGQLVPDDWTAEQVDHYRQVRTFVLVNQEGISVGKAMEDKEWSTVAHNVGYAAAELMVGPFRIIDMDGVVLAESPPPQGERH